jgi:hypothetical protein
MQIGYLAAEPASILYIVTGAIGLVFARFRASGQRDKSSVTMLFCRKSTHEKLRSVSLT